MVYWLTISVGFSHVAYAQDLIELDDLKQELTAQRPLVNVYNFWATWCGPCIREIPLFDALQAKYNEEVKVTLISLDHPRKSAEKVKKIMSTKDIKSSVYILNETDMNLFINAIEPSWSGAIPATIITYQQGRLFFEKEFEKGELETIILELIN